jgi:uroporphyrinogen decarboxylase
MAAMTRRENTIRAYRFQRPSWIPVSSGFPAPCWEFYGPEALEDLHAAHPVLFPNYVRGSIWPDHLPISVYTIAGKPYTDPWGCLWETLVTGMVGSVRTHPLASWDALPGFHAPDPETSDGLLPLDWMKLAEWATGARAGGHLVTFWLAHGHTFLRLQDLRGFENLLYDMADDEPRLPALIRMVEDFNAALVERYLGFEPDMVGIPEDLGSQTGPLVSPAYFRKFIKPSYLRLTRPLKERGVIVHEHSDGRILELVDDLVECGGDVLNLQDLVNGIDDIRRTVKGRMAIDLDLDRQEITVKGSPRDVENHVRECVEKLGSPEGGLSLCYQPWPPTPLENVRAVFDAMERHCTRWS